MDDSENLSSLPGQSTSLSTIECFSLNITVLTLGAIVTLTSSSGTWDHLQASLFMSFLPGVFAGLVWSGFMLIPFLVTLAILNRWRVTARRRLWLCGPSFAVFVALLAISFWTSLPRQRLEAISEVKLREASSIRVSILSGLLAGDGVAICRISETSFHDYCQHQNLTPEAQTDIVNQLKSRSLIRSASLVTSLPVFKDPIQFSRLEHRNGRSGVFALYDRASNTMVIYRFFRS